MVRVVLRAALGRLRIPVDPAARIAIAIEAERAVAWSGADRADLGVGDGTDRAPSAPDGYFRR